MLENFETYLMAEAFFTKEECRYVFSLATEKRLHRRELLLHEGEICRYKVFVCKGLLRTYSKKDDGTEYNMRFAAENTWTTDPESYNTQTPSRFNIEALEDTEILLWSQQTVEELMTDLPAFRTYSEKVKEGTLYASQSRILMNISYTAEEKYQEFINSFPDVFGRIPLHMVASYLGVSRETLSRIRHAQLKRQMR